MNAILSGRTAAPASIEAAIRQAAIERRAADLFRSGYSLTADRNHPSWYWVENAESGKCYYLTLSDPLLGGARCTCPYWTHNRLDCKHIIATRLEFARLDAICSEYERDRLSAETTSGCDWPDDL